MCAAAGLKTFSATGARRGGGGGLLFGGRLVAVEGAPAVTRLADVGVAALEDFEGRADDAAVIELARVAGPGVLEPLRVDEVADPHAVDPVVHALDGVADLVEVAAVAALAPVAGAVGVEVERRVDEHLQDLVAERVADRLVFD